MSEEEKVRAAVGGVLCNSLNYPREAAAHVLGRARRSRRTPTSAAARPGARIDGPLSKSLPLSVPCPQSRRTTMAEITLRDIDNRDGDGAPYEFTGSVEQVIGYLDGPLRADLTDSADGGELDDAIRAVRGGDIGTANGLLKPMSIYLHATERSAE